MNAALTDCKSPAEIMFSLPGFSFVLNLCPQVTPYLTQLVSLIFVPEDYIFLRPASGNPHRPSWDWPPVRSYDAYSCRRASIGSSIAALRAG